MIAAQFPEIAYPKTTVEFLIDGLRFNPGTATIGSQLIAPNPKDNNDFVHKFNSLDFYRKSTLSHPLPCTARKEPPIQFHTHLRPHGGTTGTPVRQNLLILKIPAVSTFHEESPTPTYRTPMKRRGTPLSPHHTSNPRPKPYQTARADRETFENSRYTIREHNPMTSHDTQEENCTYILDSGAHPSHMIDLSLLQKPQLVNRETKKAIN